LGDQIELESTKTIRLCNNRNFDLICAIINDGAQA
jgi:hypothetical protein